MKHGSTVRIQAFFLIGFLVLQYLLGMLTNLFVTFPEGTDIQHWEFARTQLLLTSHIILGMLLLVGAVVLYVKAYRAKSRTWKLASGFGLGAILLAIMTGSEFISSQQAYYSLSMSLLFLVAVASYGWGLYRSKKSGQ